MTALTLLASLPLPVLLLIVGCIFTLLLIAFLTIALVPTAGKRFAYLLGELRCARDYPQLSPHDQLQMKSLTPETGVLHITLLIERSDALPCNDESITLRQILNQQMLNQFVQDHHKVSAFIGLCGVGKAHKVVEFAQACQDKAFEQMTQDHHKLFLSIASDIVSNYDTAQDIVQDALEKAYRALQLYPEERLRNMRLKPWVCKIVVHTALNHQKSKSKEKYLTLSSDWFAEKQGPLFEQPEFQLLRSEVMFTLTTALDTLPQAQKDIVLLRFFEGCSMKEIAQQLSYPVGTVKSYLHRALASLRVVLEKEGNGAGDIAAFVKAGSDLLADLTVPTNKNMLTPEYEYVP